MTALTGGCACGKVRFTADGAPNFTFLCQCRDCQKMTGGAHAPQICHDAAAFRLTGAPAHHERTAASGHIVRHHFCGDCGSPVYGTTTRAPGIVMILAGLLDDPALVTPDRIFFADEKIDWDHASVTVDPEAPQR